MELISVIVPVYNVEQYLHCCIESILNQTFKNFELILINDGSTDNSGAICDEYKKKDTRIHVFHKENSGLSAARNVGIEHAQGEYLIFVDSDDYWAGTDALQHLYDIAKKNDADIVRGEYMSIDDNGYKIKTATKNKKNIELKILDSATFYTQAIAGENFSWLFLFKRSSIGELRFNEKRKFQEDIEFNICYNSLPHKCIYTSKKFYIYRKRSQSITTTIKISNLQGSFSLCYVFDKYINLTADTKLKDIFRYNSIMMYYWTLETIACAPYYNIREQIIKELSLERIQHQVCIWAKMSSQNYPLYIYINPKLGIKLLHIKLVLYKIVSKCKQN